MSEEYETRGDGGELGAPEERTEGLIEFDRLFSLLSTTRRRHALYCLAEASAATLSMSDLVDELAAIERRTSDAPSREEIELALRHTHLPKLSEAGVIDYDPGRAVVSYRGGRRVDRWVDRAMDAELARSID